jgi:hypothetical protein
LSDEKAIAENARHLNELEQKIVTATVKHLNLPRMPSWCELYHEYQTQYYHDCRDNNDESISPTQKQKDLLSQADKYIKDIEKQYDKAKKSGASATKLEALYVAWRSLESETFKASAIKTDGLMKRSIGYGLLEMAIQKNEAEAVKHVVRHMIRFNQEDYTPCAASLLNPNNQNPTWVATTKKALSQAFDERPPYIMRPGSMWFSLKGDNKQHFVANIQNMLICLAYDNLNQQMQRNELSIFKTVAIRMGKEDSDKYLTRFISKFNECVQNINFDKDIQSRFVLLQLFKAMEILFDKEPSFFLAKLTNRTLLQAFQKISTPPVADKDGKAAGVSKAAVPAADLAPAPSTTGTATTTTPSVVALSAPTLQQQHIIKLKTEREATRTATVAPVKNERKEEHPTKQIDLKIAEHRLLAEQHCAHANTLLKIIMPEEAVISYEHAIMEYEEAIKAIRDLDAIAPADANIDLLDTVVKQRNSTSNSRSLLKAL